MQNLLLKKYALPFFAFVAPILVRAIPEIIMAPYVVGFDTMAHYIPTCTLWLNGNVTLSTFIGTAPLFYTIVISLLSLTGSLELVLKIIPTLLQGFLSLAIYGYTRKGLEWSQKKSLSTALLGTLYFVAMRISMDSLRNMLGLVFLFVVLTLYSISDRKSNPRKFYSLMSIAALAVVLTHQLVSVIMFGIFVFTIGYKLIIKQRKKAINLILAILPATILFVSVLFLFTTVSEFRLLFGFPNTNDGWLALFGFESYPTMLLSEAGFFFYCYLPLLPFIILGSWRLKNVQIRSWIVLSIILLLVPMVSPSNLRWILMLTYPLTFCVIEAISKIKPVQQKRFKINLQAISLIYLILMTSILSLGFMLMPTEKPFPYFTEPYNNYIYQIPSSMLQNTVTKNDCAPTLNGLQWFKTNKDNNALLLTHRAFYGWALLTIPANQAILYEYDNPLKTANTLASQGHDKLYMIWWINGQGWYGQTSVPPEFIEVYRSQEIAIYSYNP